MQKKLFGSIVFLSLCAVVATAQGDKGGLKVAGTWNVTGVIDGGKKVPDEIFTKVKIAITFKDGKYSASTDGKEEEAGTYTINAKTKPAQIDLLPTTGKDKGKAQLGLIKIDGEVMTFAATKNGDKDRPKNFEGGDNITVIVLKRGK